MFTNQDIIAAAKSGAAKYKDLCIDYLKEFASFDSGSRNVTGNEKVVSIVDRMLSCIEGIRIEHHFFEGVGTNIVARLTPADPHGKIILNAHLDTVFEEGAAAAHPYREEGDTAYGLGIADCKGGVITAIHAVRIMQEAGMLPQKEICFIFNCDEEIGSATGKQVFASEIEGAEAAFIFEPSRTDDGIITSRKGFCSITIDVEGKKAHSGINYLDGRSAILELASRMLRLYECNDNERGIQFNIGEVKNYDPGNIVSGHASAEVSVRVSSREDMKIVEEIVRRVNEMPPYIPDTKTEVRINSFGAPMERTEGNVRLYEKVRDAGKLLGYDLPEQSTGGSSDGNWFSFNGIPTVDAMGPYMYEIHSYNEHLRLSSVEKRLAISAAVLGLMGRN